MVKYVKNLKQVVAASPLQSFCWARKRIFYNFSFPFVHVFLSTIMFLFFFVLKFGYSFYSCNTTLQQFRFYYFIYNQFSKRAMLLLLNLPYLSILVIMNSMFLDRLLRDRFVDDQKWIAKYEIFWLYFRTTKYS